MTTVRLNYKELVRFLKPHSLIARRASGPLYRGCLRSNQIVAIKLLNGRGAAQQFVHQTLLLTTLRHENIVKLMGYCIEDNLRLLVFEFVPLGSLAHRLHDHPAGLLDWSLRMKIAAGTAKGLEYLHHQATPPVMHGDLNPSSVLLDNSFQPKLSSFGSAELGVIRGSHTFLSTGIVSSSGYIAPEYAMTGELSLKSDVYSFGVVLLELITGRRAMDSSRCAEESNLVVWAHPYMQDASLFGQLADPKLHDRYPLTKFVQAITIAISCLNKNASLRPSIAEIAPSLDLLASPAS